MTDPYAGLSGKDLTLFHAMRSMPDGHALKPGLERDVNGKKGKFLFATPYLAKTLMFAFDWHAGEAILGGAVEGSPDQYIIICEKEKTLAKKIYLRVYSFNGEGFEKTLYGSAYIPRACEGKIRDTREFFTEKEVPLSRMTVAYEITDIETLMRKGLQIFSTSETKKELIEEGFVGEKYHALSAHAWLAELQASEGFIWENAHRGINPNKILEQDFTQVHQSGKPVKPSP